LPKIKLTFLPEPVGKPGHVTVAVKGIGDEIQRIHARQLVKGTGRYTTKQEQNISL